MAAVPYTGPPHKLGFSLSDIPSRTTRRKKMSINKCNLICQYPIDYCNCATFWRLQSYSNYAGRVLICCTRPAFYYLRRPGEMKCLIGRRSPRGCRWCSNCTRPIISEVYDFGRCPDSGLIASGPRAILLCIFYSVCIII